MSRLRYGKRFNGSSPVQSGGRGWSYASERAPDPTDLEVMISRHAVMRERIKETQSSMLFGPRETRATEEAVRQTLKPLRDEADEAESRIRRLEKLFRIEPQVKSREERIRGLFYQAWGLVEKIDARLADCLRTVARMKEQPRVENAYFRKEDEKEIERLFDEAFRLANRRPARCKRRDDLEVLVNEERRSQAG